MRSKGWSKIEGGEAMVRDRMELCGRPGHVYFIRAAQPIGLIKIGWTTHPAYRRLDALQSGSPIVLEGLGVRPGRLKDEIELHKRFAHLQEHHEWFRPAQDLLDYIRDECREFPRPQSRRTPKERKTRVERKFQHISMNSVGHLERRPFRKSGHSFSIEYNLEFSISDYINLMNEGVEERQIAERLGVPLPELVFLRNILSDRGLMVGYTDDRLRRLVIKGA